MKQKKNNYNLNFSIIVSSHKVFKFYDLSHKDIVFLIIQA